MNRILIIRLFLLMIFAFSATYVSSAIVYLQAKQYLDVQS